MRLYTLGKRFSEKYRFVKCYATYCLAQFKLYIPPRRHISNLSVSQRGRL